jgi:Cu(I)/Ag(I) efflux system periplasmic protein CusF
MKLRNILFTIAASTLLVAAPYTLASGQGHGNHHNHGAHNHGSSEERTADGIGEVRALGAEGKSVVLRHEPIRALRWPAMTMELPLAKAELAEGLEKGAKVSFTLRQTGPTDYEIIRIAPVR